MKKTDDNEILAMLLLIKNPRTYINIEIIGPIVFLENGVFAFHINSEQQELCYRTWESIEALTIKTTGRHFIEESKVPQYKMSTCKHCNEIIKLNTMDHDNVWIHAVSDLSYCYKYATSYRSLYQAEPVD